LSGYCSPHRPSPSPTQTILGPVLLPHPSSLDRHGRPSTTPAASPVSLSPSRRQPDLSNITRPFSPAPSPNSHLSRSAPRHLKLSHPAFEPAPAQARRLTNPPALCATKLTARHARRRAPRSGAFRRAHAASRHVQFTGTTNAVGRSAGPCCDRTGACGGTRVCQRGETGK
jgi:hypothetical protein